VRDGGLLTGGDDGLVGLTAAVGGLTAGCEASRDDACRGALNGFAFGRGGNSEQSRHSVSL